MRIQRPRRIGEQEALARELKTELLRLIRRRLGRPLPFGSADQWQSLYRLVELSAPGYSVKTKARSASQIDRRASMLSGPFYTSPAFPAPMDVSGRPMFPILQLDLNDAAAAIQQPLGDGLLQLWHGVADASTSIRVVPLLAAYQDEPSPFVWNASPDATPIALPGDWNTDPCGDAVHEIVELVASGFECQGSSIQAIYDCMEPEKLDWLGTLLTLFQEKAKRHRGGLQSEIRLFGAFYPIQYDSADVGLPCLMSMQWYASGGAQLFYELRKGEVTAFDFRSCPR